MPGMPWRLYRYLLLELLRIIGLTAAVLVVVTAFGAVIKPLATGVPLGPGQALTYVGLSTVPMLQYALPFAAGFGATLVLHRMAADNEINAMAAAGLPYRVILAPVIALAIVLAVVLTVLANTAIPRIYAVMGRVLAGDMVTLMEHSVRKGQPMSIGDMQIWAAGMRPGTPPPGGGTRVQLDRVAAARVAPDGAILGDVSARAAVLEMQEQDGVVEVRMVMEDAVSWDARGGGLRGFPRIEPTRPVRIPMPERVEPMAMTRAELIDASRHPARYPPIAKMLLEVRDALARFQIRTQLRDRLVDHGELTLDSVDRPGHRWRIQAAGLSGASLEGGASGIRIEQVVDGRTESVFHPTRASLAMQATGGLSGVVDPGLIISMQGVRVTSADAGVPENHRAAVDVANLLARDIRATLPLSDESLLVEARTIAGEDAAVRKLLVKLDHREALLQGQVTSRLWRRWAIGITAGLLPLLGAVLALLLRHAQPLLVYTIGFVPGLFDLVLISAGAGGIRQGSHVGGLVLMWSGTAVVCLATALAWWRLRRN